MVIDQLNQGFAISEHICFCPLPNQLSGAVINNRYGAALVSLEGAHVMSYRPHAGREVLWQSPAAAFELSPAMRGGIPVCWPWFAYEAHDPARDPIHGIVRTQSFRVVQTLALPDGATRLLMLTSHTQDSLVFWPHEYEFLVEITLGESLSVECIARNPGSSSFSYTGALHPYFSVSNVHDLTLRGLEQTSYLDNLAGLSQKFQPGPVTFPAGIDNIYLNTTADMTIEDPGFQRSIVLRKTGSRTSVVWNPYQDDAGSADIGAGQHINFLCVEAANASDDVVVVSHGDEKRLGMQIKVENWRKL